MIKSKNQDVQRKLKVFLDTNVLFSAIFWPNGKAYRSVQKAFVDYLVFTSDYVLQELKGKSEERFPGNSWRIDRFFSLSRFKLSVLETPEIPVNEELLVRDPDDRSIVRAAIYAGVDMIISGDLDLREAGFEHPLVLNANEFLNLPNHSEQ